MITVVYGKEKIHFHDNLDNNNEMTALEVQTKGQHHSYTLSFATTTVADFKERLLSWWHQEHQQPDTLSAQTVLLSSTEEIKLIVHGKVVSNAEQVLTTLFPSSSLTTSTTQQQQRKELKITMIANPLTKETIHQLEEEKIKANELKEKLKRRKLVLSKTSSKVQRERRGGPITYGFHRITTLANLPHEEKAKEILENLANDSGIIAVMNKYKFTVNELTELYPDGQVGVSDVCVMGLNQNHGQKILLRLRTDDLKGFRKMLSIKKVLYHELAHNLYSEHDNQFYLLMRQIEKDANELSWEKSRGFSLLTTKQRESYIRPEKHFLEEEEEDDDEEEQEEKQQTVFTLGGGDNNTTTATTTQLPPNRIAGEAAILRFHQFQKQREEQRYNQYIKKQQTDDETNPTSDRIDQNAFISERSNVEGKEQFQENKESEENEDAGSGSGSGSDKDEVEVEVEVEVQVEKPLTSEEISPMEVEDDIHAQETITVVDYIPSDEMFEEKHTSDHLSEVMIVEKTVREEPPMKNERMIEEEKKAIEEEMITTGKMMKREKLLEKREIMNKLFEDCIIMILSDETLTSTVEKILTIKDILMTLYDSKILKNNNSSNNTSHYDDNNYQQFINILQLFITILQNIQNHPEEEKYKRIKRTNKMFLRSISGMEESIGILYQSGFEENSSSSSSSSDMTSELIYKKKDLGLLYLVKSMLQAIHDAFTRE